MITGRRPYPKWLVRGLVVFAAGMTVLAAIASREHHGSESAKNAAVSRLVAFEARSLEHSDPALGMQLALVAYRLSQTTEARSALLDATAGEMPTRVSGRPGQTALAVAEDGHLAAVAHQGDDQVVLFALRFGRLSRVAAITGGPRTARLNAVALSADGRLLATGDSSGQVTLWSLSRASSPRQLALLNASGVAVNGLSFSPGGSSLAAADIAGRVERWSLTDPTRPVGAAPLVATGQLDALSYSPDGRSLAAVGRGATVVVWSAHAGTRPLASVALGGAALTAVAYSPNGRMLAVGDRSGGVQVRALNARGIPAQNGGSLTTGGSIASLAFSRDGRYLAAGTAAKAAPVWSTASLTEVADLPHPAGVTGLAFTGGDRHLLTTDAAGTAMLWQFPAPSTYTFGSALTGLTYSTSSPRLAVTLQSGRTDQWNVADEWGAAPVGAWYASAPPAAPVQPHHAANAVPAVNPHAGDQALRQTEAQTAVTSSLLSPDGELLAAGGSDHLVWLWDVSDPTSPQLLAKLSGFSAGVSALIFSGNSQTLFAGSADHTVRIWSVTKPAKPLQLPSSPLIGPSTAITRLALSPDNHTLAVATVEGHVWLWAVANPSKASLTASLTAARGRLTALAFSPSDNTLVAGGANRRLTFWHYRPFEAVNRICSLAGTAITANEWKLWVQGASYNPPCARWTPPAPAAKSGSAH